MFLGESETINGFDDRFSIVDAKGKIYKRKPYTQHPQTGSIDVQPRRTRDIVLKETGQVKGPSMNEKAEKILLSEHTPPSLIVNNKNEIVYFHGPTSKYLGPATGMASLNIQNLLREDIRYEVMSAINESRSTLRTMVKEGIQVY